MFYTGSLKTIKAIEVYIKPYTQNSTNTHLTKYDFSMIYIIESIDAFLLALVLMIFSYGILRIFILNIESKSKKENDIKEENWINVSSVGQLKMKLIEVIIVMLFVFFLKVILVHIENASWEMLILPFSILVLSTSLYLLKKSDK